MISPSSSRSASYDRTLCPPHTAPPSVKMVRTTLRVEGMTCGACVSAIESGFEGVKGVQSVSVSLVMGRGVVEHDSTVLSPEKVKEMIEDRGFDADILSTEPLKCAKDGLSLSLNNGGPQSRLSTTTLSVKGMTCGSCTSAIETGLKGIDGVVDVTVSLLSERAVVQHDGSKITPDQIAEIIEDRGFDAAVLDIISPEQPGNTSQINESALKKSPTQMSTTVSIKGMTCGACTSAVEGALKNEPGLIRFNISLLAERGVVVHNPATLPTSKIVQLIEDAGFDAFILSSDVDSSFLNQSSASLGFNLYGLTDAATATSLETQLRGTSGVLGANVKLSNSRVSITYEPSRVGIRALVDVCEKAGCNVLIADSEDNDAQLESLAKTKEIQEWRRAFWFSLSFAVPVMFISMLMPMYLPGLDFGSFEIIHGLFLGDLVCLFLTIPVQFGIGMRFYRSSFKALKHRSPTMDVLVMLSTSLAFAFSVLTMLVSLLCMPHSRPSVVFETSTMLITFITLGRWLENRAKGQTSRALSKLMSLTPSMATIYEDPIAAEKTAEMSLGYRTSTEEKNSPSGPVRASNQKTIPTELLQVGDVVCLLPGDKIAADGMVIRGETYVDESMVTGEANPIHKIQGAQVIAGTVNGSGWVDFRVIRAGRDTQLSQIVKLVQNAQTSRAPIQRMADVVAGYFVPAILTLGLITFVGWMVLSHLLPTPPDIFLRASSGGTLMVCLKLCISVIVFACPCALGLSTPTAVMVGTGVGAEHGILVKGGAALESATKIRHVVFDKTGTLTTGKTTVADAKIERTWSSNEWRRRLWWLVVGLTEMTSEHPVGKTIVSAAKAENGASNDDPLNGSVVQFEASVGKGVSALVEPASGVERVRFNVCVGNAVYLRSKNIQVPVSVDADADGPLSPTISRIQPSKYDTVNGATRVHVAIDGAYTGTIWLEDSLKPTAKAAVAALHRMGLTTSIVTGDTFSTARAVAAAVGIPADSIHASVSPIEKQAIIAKLQTVSGISVAMVGDGINDSPALATASVGIALSSGTDVAMEAADIVLMRPDDLLSVPASLCLAKSIFRRIKLNLLWACLYNAIGLPFAMGVFLPFGGISLHPMAAGAAMAASSVSVVVSSLLLKLWKRPRWLDTEKLEREIEQGKIDPIGYRRRGSDTWWQSSPFASDQPVRIGRGATRLFQKVVKVLRPKTRKTEEDGYVPLQTVEPTS
ncbi:Cu(2+)-transporting P-type ATPase [Ophidiomyces ophidiicola]|nr:Cu(2+)-transporting P-type ATPase [Ophidiomyces ophidiicola]KAI2098166.1 Cu(2+)-transporting P-type ATPase [Ophidiomyces ophidiicola]KAI2164219.1 Cu(2+)-transporting P-type ATPase [Ophidiomyces ophidiicola]KAI2265368.1 Cu(2+)-transporting P-type ATPase [Ophidiomyces ophidiicola]KAI2277961.1 Cu(2+)-transporting P-type ATPase [Ophidiomyces ophidiicola]